MKPKLKDILPALVFAGSLSILPCQAQSKDMYFLCERGFDWKFSKSWFGSGELFYDKEGEWVKLSNAIVKDDQIISPEWTQHNSNGSKCSPCEFKVVIPLFFSKIDGVPVSRIKSVITSEECSVDLYGSSCFSYKKGAVREEEDCRIAER